MSGALAATVGADRLVLTARDGVPSLSLISRIDMRPLALATRGERNIRKLCDEALMAEGFSN